jgi:ADP-ribose pyrophosphatase YjhB (NUDIX family)
LNIAHATTSFFVYLRKWWNAPAKDSVYRKTTVGDTVESSVRGVVISFLFMALSWLAENALSLPIDEDYRYWVSAIAGALVTLIQIRRRYYRDSTGAVAAHPATLPAESDALPPPADGPDNRKEVNP